MFEIYTNQHETVLYTDKFAYVSESCPVDDGEGDPIILIFVEFVPNNGHAAGKKARMPLAQVNMIAEKDKVTT